jgi:glycine hydroxymethyltransferase
MSHDHLGVISTPVLSQMLTQDPSVASLFNEEYDRQAGQLEMIASENFASRAVIAAMGSVLTNKYAEGYPGKRYYNGCDVVDKAEALAIERACALFKCRYANVQPHAGSQANQEVFFSLLQPGDTILGMKLDHGGHLTHGSKVNLSGKWFQAIGYGINPQTHLIQMDEVEALAREHRPKLIIAGGSSYPRTIDFEAFRRIADEVGAYFMVDMAHFAGLVAGGVFPNPLPHAHVVTTTTHKTLRGPRGGMILSNDPDMEKRLNSAVFPGMQGGPLMHVIAAKAIAFGEALQPSFKTYARQIIDNAQSLATAIQEEGLSLLTGGTDCHLIVVDLRAYNLTGAEAADALEQAGITCNKNSIPYDPLPPTKTSGLRLGTPALTTRGMTAVDCQWIGKQICTILKALRDGSAEKVIPTVRQDIMALCQRYPLYPAL